MNNLFTYSVLQYKHSLVLGESINVGILFAFPDEKKVEFVYGNSTRLKAIYPHFDTTLFGHLLKNVENKIRQRSNEVFFEDSFNRGIVEFIHTQILREDSTTLQFKEPIAVNNYSHSRENAVKEFSAILLPGIIQTKPIIRQTEDLIIKKFTRYIFDKKPELENRIERNPIISTENLSLKFDLAWQNGSLNIVKAISFDLLDKGSIQNKAVTNFGALTALRDVASDKKIKFDLIISPPQSEAFFVSYKNALALLNTIDVNKEIILSNGIEQFSERTIDELESH